MISKHDDPDSDDESDDDDGSDHQERLLMEGMMKRSFEITLHGASESTPQSSPLSSSYSSPSPLSITIPPSS